MVTSEHPSLVDAQWLATHLDEPDLVVADASWHLPNSGRHAGEEYLAAHIPGALFFDLERIADPASSLPHMLPTAAHFADAVGRMGVDNDTTVVVYDSSGLFSAARAWWMFRAFGHERVAVLDGGLPEWRAHDLPVATGPTHPVPVLFRPPEGVSRVWTIADVQRNLDTGEAVVVDARSQGRFTGDEPEPRPGLPSGHIPGSINVAYAGVTAPDTGRVQPPAALRELFQQLDQRPVVCTCGTGVTACALAFALHQIGRTDVAVYDGSWTEWARHPDNPIAIGPD